MAWLWAVALPCAWAAVHQCCAGSTWHGSAAYRLLFFHGGSQTFACAAWCVAFYLYSSENNWLNNWLGGGSAVISGSGFLKLGSNVGSGSGSGSGS